MKHALMHNNFNKEDFKEVKKLFNKKNPILTQSKKVFYKKFYFSFILTTAIVEIVDSIKIGNQTDKISGNFPFSPKRFEKWLK